MCEHQLTCNLTGLQEHIKSFVHTCIYLLLSTAIDQVLTNLIQEIILTNILKYTMTKQVLY